MSRRKETIYGIILVLALLVLAERESPGLFWSSKPLDLGVAQYPEAGESEYQDTRHRWARLKEAAAYQVIYRYGEKARASSWGEHAALGNRFNYREVRRNQFQWTPPRDCQRQGLTGHAGTWACVYGDVLANSRHDLVPLVNRLSEGMARDQVATTTDAARWLLDFVQNIPYRIPEEQDFGLLPPALVVSAYWGDCDSKSLLLLHLLRRFDISAYMLISRAHEHAVLGINVPYATEDTFEVRGRHYAWAETTARLPLGRLNPRFLSPDDWQVIWVP